MNLDRGRHTSGLQSFSRRLLASAASVALILGQVAAANANPAGGTVTSGKATISTPASGTLQIDQTTKIVIINWNSFNIAGGETTKFVQPNSSSIAVNRIGGNDPSTILGSLLANGKVVLINGNGILFGPGSKINVGSLLATTSDASDADIASGKAKFDKAGNPNAQIINQGNITAASGGMVGLIAPAVSNSGTITARLGSVTLGASNVFTVDFTGDGLVSFPVDGNVVAAAIGKNGKPVEALVVNDGKISGGTVMLTARAAASLVTNVISMKGEIAATSAHDAGGKIVLDGGNSGDIAVAGSLNASGTSGGSISVVSQGTTSISGTITAKNTTGKGGSIETSGHNLSIGGAKIDAGQGGSWLLDPYDLTVDATAATTIDTALDAGTNTTLQTEAGSASGAGVQNASGSGDIIVASALTWSGTGVLTLDAYRNVAINAPVTITGAGGLAVVYGDTTSTGVNDGVPADGAFSFNSSGNVAFTTTSSGNNTALSFNGQAYTLENNIVDLASAIGGDASGFYALAKNYDATPDGTYTSSPISTTFTGTFEGLGNAISNLTINDTANANVGLFAQNTGTIRDIGLVNATVTSSMSQSDAITLANGGAGVLVNVGALVGDNTGKVLHSYASGAVQGGDISDAGGLVGYNEATGTIDGSYTNGTVLTGNSVAGLASSWAGGLAAQNSGTITNSYSKANVTGGNGIQGNSKTIIGGLIGLNDMGADIEQSYATGAVVSGQASQAGGLAGENDGTIGQSYASGSATGGDDSRVGGLVGRSYGSISYSYALGAVSVGANGTDATSTGAGGLVGYSAGASTITESYSTGAVTAGSGMAAGAFVGRLAGGGTITSGYFDSNHSGLLSGVGFDAGSGNATVTGLTSAQMMDPSNYSFSTDFGVLGSGSKWVIVDADGTLNGSNGATLPMLLSEYSTTIVNAHQLQLMALDLTANYTLGSNVAAQGTTGGDVWGNNGFIPVGGNGAGPFTGNLDGAGHAVDGLYISSNNQQVGLFGEIGTPNASGGKVANLAIIDADVTGTNPASAGAGDGIGVLAGEDFSTISNVFVSGTVQQSEHQGAGVSDANIGGMVGFFGSGNGAGPVISDSGADVSVNANGGASSAGGLVGYMFDGAAIERSYATGQVTDGADGNAGGLVGFTFDAVSIDKSYATGDVIAGQGAGIGGFIGYLDAGGTIDESYSAGDVHADASSVTGNLAGGFAGLSNGTIGGVVANYYNGGGINAGLPSVGTGATGGAVALTSLTVAGFAGWTFGGLGSGADWVMIDADGTINNAGGADAGATPMLLSEYSTKITNAHQLQLMALDLTANYTLANNIDATGTGNGSDVWLDSTGFIPVGGDTTNDNTTQFAGSFDGKGHTITNLTIVDIVPGANETAFKGVIDTANANNLSPVIYGQGTNVGLFGYVAGAGSVTNVGLVGGSVTGTYNVGALAGTSDGTIKNAYSTAAVTGDDSFGYDNSANFNTDPSVGKFYGGVDVGGLIGVNTGLVDHAYASGEVSGASVVGGLAGGNFTDGTQIATIQNSYATGDVTGSSVSGATYGSVSFVGGLVGQSGTSLAGGAVVPVLLNDYATGNVTGNDVVGGLAGNTNSGAITNSYATGSVTGTGDDPYDIGGLIGFVGDQGAVGTTVTNSYATGAVSGSDTVGGLVGVLKGGDTISHSYATGSVTALDPNDGYEIGGLVGEDRGLIEYSYATGTVSGEGWVGGLVGALTRQGSNPGNPIFANTAGSITNSYALGSVHGGGIDVVGGFVGYIQSGTTISDSYSAGLVTAPSSFVGGFAGRNSGTITNSYWDTGTSGMAAQFGVGTIDGSTVANNAPGVTGKTTAQLQGSLPTGFDSSVWAIQTGLSYPYLQWQAANGAPVFVSGTAFSNEAGTTPLAGTDINAVTSGRNIATVTSGANGYYYFMLEPNAIPGTGLGVYFTGTGGGGTFEDNNFGSQTGLNIDSSLLTIHTGDATISTTGFNLGTTFGTLFGDEHTNVAAFANGLDSDVTILADSAYAVDQLENVHNAVSITSGGTLTVSQQLGMASPFATTPSVSLKTTSGNIVLNAGVVASGTVALNSAGTIGGNSSGTITAGALTGSSHGTVTLTAANIITNLGAFTTSGNNAFAVTDAHDLTVTGAVNTGTAGLTLTTTGGTSDIFVNSTLTGGAVTLVSAATISENVTTGKVLATTLTGSSHGATTLNGANVLTNLGAFTTNGNNAFSLTDAHSLNVNGAVTAGSAGVTLATTGGTNAMTLAASLTGGTVTLNSAGTINQTAGVIATGTLTGSAHGATTLNGANVFTSLGAFTTNGNNAFAVTDAHDLTVTGAVNSGTAGLTLTTTGGTSDIMVNNALTGGTVTLASGATISETGGVINATTLTGSSHGTTTLNGANMVTNLGAFTTNGNNAFALTDAHDLTVTGAANAGTASLMLTTTGIASDIFVNSTLTGGTVTLASGATIGETGGVITATTLTGSSHGATTLNGANVITNLGAFTTGGNNAIALTDAHDLTVTGAVNAGTAGLTLTTTGGASDIFVNSALTGGTVTLASGATIGETGGVITATTLTGSSHGATTLNGANMVTNLGAFTTNGNNAFSVTDAHDLTVTGAVNAGTAGLTLATTGSTSDIMVNSTLTGGTVTLASGATIGETGGVITATTLTGSSHGATTLNGANMVTNLGAFTTGGNNAFALTDAHDLTVTGAVNAGSAGLTLTTTGVASDIFVNSMLTGGTVTLASGATIGETGGVINSTTLTGSSHGATTLNGANVFANLGAFTTNGNNAFAVTDAHDLTVTGAVNAGTAGLTLTTTGSTSDIMVNSTLTGGTVTLASGATISENVTTGKVLAATLTGSSHGAATLNGANVFTNLGAFTTNGNNAFAVTDAHDLTVTGAVNAGTAGLTLTTTGSTSDIMVNNALTGGTVTLASGATISENVATGKVLATTLTGSSHGATTLNGANVVTNVGAFTTGGNNAFALTDAHSLNVSGAVAVGTAGLTLTTTGGTNAMVLAANLTGGTVAFNSAGTVNQTGGVINATTLTGYAHGATTLNRANTITNLGAFATNNGSLALTDAQALAITGAVNAGTGTLALKTTAGSLTIKALLTAATTTLTSAAQALESGAGAIHSTTLNVTAATGINLSGANVITTIGTNHTTSGSDVIVH